MHYLIIYLKQYIGIFHHSVTKIPVQEMTSLLNITVQKKPLQKGQYVRMRRGPLKGDLVQVADLLEGGSKAMIKAIPRPDYSDEYSNRGDKTKTRPPQRLLNLESVGKGAGGNFERKYHAADKHGGRYGMILLYVINRIIILIVIIYYLIINLIRFF